MNRYAQIAVAALIMGGVAVLAIGADPAGADGRQIFGLWRTRYVAAAGLLFLVAYASWCGATSRRRVFRFVLAVMLVAFALLLLETVGQLGLASYARLMGNARYVPTNEVGAIPRPHIQIEGETLQDIALRWGIDQEPVPFAYRTDQRGFRNREDREAADVYLLGDSIVVAGLIPFHLTMTARLEAALERSVMNVALIGIGVPREHAIFEEAELPLEGRLVLQFLFEGNDLLDAAISGSDPKTESVVGNRFRERSFLHNAELAIQRLTQPEVGLAERRSCEIGGQRYLFAWTWNSFQSVEHRQVPLFQRIESFARAVERTGGVYVLVFVPAKIRVVGPSCEHWPPTSDLRDAIDENPLRASAHRFHRQTGVPLIDLTEPLRAAAHRGEIPWFWGDTHWNEAGHRIVAAALAEAPEVRAWHDSP